MNPSVSTAPDPAAARGRMQLLLLATLFFLPLLASFVLYFGFPGLRPSGTTNYGELVTPARTLPEFQFISSKGGAMGTHDVFRRWSLVTMGGAACDAACEQHLLMTRQVRTAMNADRERIRRVLVLDDAAALGATAQRLAAEHPDLEVVADATVQGVRLHAFFEGHDALAFLLDPHANWLMFYPVGSEQQNDFKGIRKDLKKLLSLSQIG